MASAELSVSDDAGAGAGKGTPPERPLLRLGRSAWAGVGIIVLLALLALAAVQVAVVVVPLVLALFPAALLAPVTGWLKRHRLPPALASLLSIVGGLALLTAAVAVLARIAAAEVPDDLAESLSQGVQGLNAALGQAPFLDIQGIEDLGQRVQDMGGGQLPNVAAGIAATAVEVVVGTVFLFVALFFYLKDGEQISDALRTLVPSRIREDLVEMSRRAWRTLGSFFRGQLLVAVVDAVLIGVGLLLLGVPLALPLAALVFFGGLFPIVGAIVSGALAVLVALADGGLGLGIAVFVLVLAVQQAESNILAPVVLGRAIKLHPLLVVLVITGAAGVVGVLGAFLAVPVTASIARAVDYLREHDHAPA